MMRMVEGMDGRGEKGRGKGLGKFYNRGHLKIL